MTRIWQVLFVGVISLALSVPCFGKEPTQKKAASTIVALKVQPASLTLDNKRDVWRVLVLGKRQDGAWVDLSRTATLKPAAAIVGIDKEGNVSPLKKGATKIVVSAGGKQVSLPVTVKSVDDPPVSYVRDVQPILSKSGCNAGTCHGAAKGRNGFKLSLRGYDPDYDYRALVEDVSGRRFNRTEPSESLMLLKPVQGVPHMGGLVFEKNSRFYKTIHRWIAEGTKFDGAKRVEMLEVLPASPTLDKEGVTQQVLVIAHYPDGTTRDVTRDAIYTSSVPEVAEVTQDGLVKAVRRGETALLVRYEGAYATNPMIVMGDRSGYRWVAAPQFNYVDKLIDKKLQRVKSLPSPLCRDAEFVRRVYLDLAGVPPTPEKVRAFLEDTANSKTKRERLVDELLETEEFVDHWTNKWADLLECNRKFIGEKGVWLFREWIQQSIAANKPYDAFVRELLTASGSSYESAPANYFRVTREPATATENITQLFLGVRFSCNKCHDHPFERWTQTQYYEFGAFFAQVGIKRGDLEGDEVVYDRFDGGEVKHPKTGTDVPPAAPVAYSTHSAQGESRREKLVNWLTSAENPFFARAMANRLWSYFFGRGIIDPVDDIRNSNPPSNPELLDALTNDFVKSGFDLKHLMRTICRSRAYQSNIQTNKWNEDDKINFSHAEPRRLTAEQLLDAITLATGKHQKFPGVPLGFRAAQLPDSQSGISFLDMFGRPARESPCECERRSDVSLGQMLNLVNGATISDAIIAPDGRIAQLIKDNVDDRALVEAIYLATLCRLPTPSEVEKALRHISTSTSRLESAQDLMWALFNTPAFLFNR
jgi:hypothetical protein